MLAAPAAAEARGKVDVMVVGRSAVLVPAERVALKARTATVGGTRCAIGRAHAAVRARGDRGRVLAARLRRVLAPARATPARSTCARSDRTASAGSDGWVYKVGRRSGSGGAADPAGPFGTGRRLRGGQRCCGSGA